MFVSQAIGRELQFSGYLHRVNAGGRTGESISVILLLLYFQHAVLGNEVVSSFSWRQELVHLSRFAVVAM